ncbi:hypothetical protein AMS68_000249 [Peltaster fructicola]|uniref:Uncharacterized protein n=1 Tax=Peltaster fructicola TaxID=286661 RepID=A0A6H0XJ39_9PEZI|nr:hypothetical protein AMS68_000249 [Peltaster fructicola]
MSSFNIKGKTAIVTGAGSGINLSFAVLLLAGSCNVVIGDLGLRPEAQKVLDDHKDVTGAKAVFVKTDVVKWDQLKRLFDVAEEHFGSIDIVCPGAGIFEPHWTNFWHPPGSDESRDPVTGDSEGTGRYALFDINLIHPIRTTQIAISRWINAADKASQNSPRRVVHISSIAAQLPSLAAPMYAASKAGLSSFIRSLAQLDQIGIRVNGVAPGVIRTPLWTEHPEKLRMIDESKDVWVEPEDVAKAMLRCCEDDTIVGGSIVEVLKESIRFVEVLNDPGPSSKAGATASNAAALRQQVFELLSEPGWGT